MTQLIQERERFTYSYENSALTSYLVVRAAPGEKIQQYQVEMLAHNPHPAMLSLSVRQKDENLYFYYNITSRLSLERFLKRRKLNRGEFITLLKGLILPLLEAKNYLLSENGFILQEEYIFINPGTLEISMAYLPIALYGSRQFTVRDFLMRLILDGIEIEEGISDNFLQRILSYVRRDTFDLAGFDKLLKTLKNSVVPAIHQPDADKLSTPAVINEKEEREVFRIPNISLLFKERAVNIRGGTVLPEKTAAEKKAGNCNETTYGKQEKETEEKMVFKQSTIAVLGVSQVFLLILLVSLFRSGVLDMPGEDGRTTYGAVLLVAGAVDFLALRKLLDSKNKVAAAEERPENRSFPKPVINRSGMGGPKVQEAQSTAYPYGTIDESDLHSAVGSQDEEEKLPKYTTAPLSPPGSEGTALLGDASAGEAFLEAQMTDKPEKIPVRKPEFIVGRLKAQVDYSLENAAVGKIHAEILLREGCYYLRDMNSRNGTFINDMRIDSNKEYPIKNRDRITFANSHYTFIIV